MVMHPDLDHMPYKLYYNANTDIPTGFEKMEIPLLPYRRQMELDFSKRENRLSSWGIFAPIAALIYGGWHCLAWNFPFPSHAEQML